MANDERRHLSWDEFMAQLDWQQGEHVSLIGPTGGGKSTLARALLPRRSYVVVLATKPADPTLDRFKRDGYRVSRRWPPGLPRHAQYRANGALNEHRVLLWPPLRNVDDVPKQRAIFDKALASIFAEGHWCVFADELRYLCHQLGLQSYFELFWLQGRSLKVSLVASTQRPAWVPLEMYDAATHLFFWRDNDDRNLRRIGSLGGLDAKAIRADVAALAKHDVLYLNTRTGDTAITRVERT